MDVSSTDYYRASARSIGGLTIAVSSKSRIPKPSPGGRWHGAAMTDEGSGIDIQQMDLEAVFRQIRVLIFPPSWSGVFGGVPLIRLLRRHLTTVAAKRLPDTIRARQSCRFLEKGSLLPPLAALRLFPPEGKA